MARLCPCLVVESAVVVFRFDGLLCDGRGRGGRHWPTCSEFAFDHWFGSVELWLFSREQIAPFPNSHMVSPQQIFCLCNIRCLLAGATVDPHSCVRAKRCLWIKQIRSARKNHHALRHTHTQIRANPFSNFRTAERKPPSVHLSSRLTHTQI